MTFKKGHKTWNKGKKLPQMSGKNHHMFGKQLSEEHKNKLILANIGKQLSEETKRKISISVSKKLKGHKVLEETRKKISNANIGKQAWNKNIYCKKETRNKISEALKNKYKNKEIIHHMLGKKHSEESKGKIKEARAKQILPMKDTKIELKIQDFLTSLRIEFVTHKYMNIKHSYQCDILVPEQKGIKQKTIIECDGEFFHCNPNKYSEDFVRFKNAKKLKTAKDVWERDENRTKELLEKGFKVLRLWENEIRVMDLNNFQERLKA